MQEWADSLRTEYAEVERCGSAGDMGRDVIAICANPQDGWDNYQCKHYKDPLTPSKAWIELGKLMYYTYINEYTYPRKYYFIAPQGVGTKLSNLFKNPATLRDGLFQHWDEHCKSKITTTRDVILDKELRDYITQADFSIFDKIPPLRIIEGHRKTPWFIARFGGGMPSRPPLSPPPMQPGPNEANYVQAILDAYCDYLGNVISWQELERTQGDLMAHYQDCRIEFSCAEALRAFSRDYLPPGEFERLQDEIFGGLGDELRTNHSHGYQRLVATVKTARLLQLSASALSGELTPRDRGGICHQLANDLKLRWVK